MNRATLLGLFVGAGAALSACDIPSATFGATSTDTGGSTESAGGSGASTTDGGGGGHTVTHPTTGTGGSVGGSGGGSGGAGGAGGAGGSVTTTSTTTTSTTTTTTTTATTGAVVPCGEPTAEIDCSPGQWCCFDVKEPYQDLCSSSPCVASEYNTLACNGDEDCPGTQQCCGLDTSFVSVGISATYCKAACSSADDEYHMCQSSADCAGGTCYYAFSDYDGYGYCD